ncbi:MAG: hypothetical protein WBW33_18740 [Bryobacteraceae bacterium]
MSSSLDFKVLAAPQRERANRDKLPTLQYQADTYEAALKAAEGTLESERRNGYLAEQALAVDRKALTTAEERLLQASIAPDETAFDRMVKITQSLRVKCATRSAGITWHKCGGPLRAARRAQLQAARALAKARADLSECQSDLACAEAVSKQVEFCNENGLSVQISADTLLAPGTRAGELQTEFIRQFELAREFERRLAELEAEEPKQ